MEFERSSGILLHITSLTSKYGIGDFGTEAFKFIEFLFKTKQKLWQILPLTITNCPSPYSCKFYFKLRFYLMKILFLRSIIIWWKSIVNIT